MPPHWLMSSTCPATCVIPSCPPSEVCPRVYSFCTAVASRCADLVDVVWSAERVWSAVLLVQ
eukprot:1604072-Amphidinium_carterae.1